MVVTNNHTPQASMKVEGIDTEEILSRVKEELANEPNIYPSTEIQYRDDFGCLCFVAQPTWHA
jgi:hypothetical protein